MARWLRLAILSVASMAVAVPGTAHAAQVSDAVYVLGTGIYQGCFMYMNGDAVVAGDEVGLYPFQFAGNACAGAGSMAGGISGNVTFTQTAATMSFYGTVTLGNAVHDFLEPGNTCAVVTFPVVNAFEFHCAFVLID